MDEGPRRSRGTTTSDSSTVAGTDEARTLSDEHALLLREVSARAESVLREADEGRWPETQLRELVNYLQLEGLQQIVDEEWLLFSSAYQATNDLSRLRRDHLELRLAIDVLTQAAAGGARMSPAQLAAHVRSFLGDVQDHLAAEEQILAVAHAKTPATSALGARPHEWYELTEGPVIDLDRLPGKQGFDAVLDRLLRMAPGEQVELKASTDPGPIRQRLARANVGAYGAEALEKGPATWRLKITRRPDR